MCGRYGQLRESLENYKLYKESKVQKDFDFENNYNLSPGSKTMVLINEDGKYSYIASSFGLRPSWKETILLINARAEGKTGKEDNNPENDPSYSGPYNISKSGFANPYKHGRTIIPVSFFFEGPEKEALSKPFLIQQRNKEPFGLAAISRKTTQGFWTSAIITTSASKLLQKVGHHRSPLVIPDHLAEVWLDKDLPLNEIDKLLHPFDSSDFEAYEISSKLKKPNRDNCNNEISLLEPIGERIFA